MSDDTTDNSEPHRGSPVKTGPKDAVTGKPSVASSKVASSKPETAPDDATKIAAKNLTPEQKRAILIEREKRRRLALQKQQAEKQRAQNPSAAANQNAAANQGRPVGEGSDSGSDDKTLIARPLKPAASPSSDDDSTRFAPRQPAQPKTPPPSNPAHPQNSTSKTIPPVSPRVQGDDDGSKTQFKPRLPVASDSDRTEISDATRFQPRIRTEAELATKISPLDTSDDSAVADTATVLKGRFILEDVLGAGGMGVVYKAKDLLKIEAEDRDPYVAIKVLGEEFKSHPEAFIALQRESRKTQRIAHPNIVNVHDFDKDGDTVFMTMEFLDGKPLDKLIKQYKSTGLPAEDAEQILEGICAALTYAHEQNIIHSDLKPGNIFVTDAGAVKVFDFGIARAVAEADAVDETDTEDKTVFDAGNLGALTPAYASLEMLEGEEPDIRDDIYALGCIAYELFTGTHPFNRVNAKEAYSQGLKPKRIDGLSKQKWQAIQKALSFERENRAPFANVFWRQFSVKRSRSGIFTALFGLLVVASVAYFTVFYKAQDVVQVDEGKIRNELEYKIRLESLQAEITGLLEKPEFDPRWELTLKESVAEIVELLTLEDPWVKEHREKALAVYLSQIQSEIENAVYDVALEHANNARVYSNDEAVINTLIEDINARIAEAERIAEEERIAREKAQAAQRQQAIAQKASAQRREEFNVALENVNKQLACRTQLNMRDIDIAVDKLRSLDASRYKKNEPSMVSDLAACIKQIGRNFPERAEEAKKMAMRTFKGHAEIRAIKIVPRDPCDLSLAGFGARGNRAVCFDTVAGKGKSPSMVVIPAKGSMPAFAIGKYEVSIGEFSDFCEDTKSCSVSGSGDPSLPMTNVSLAQVKSYIKWLVDKTGKTYRLPKKAEWLHAARANREKIDANRNCLLNTRGIQIGGTLVKSQVGDPNPWGLVNLVGNASEWVVSRGSSVEALGGSFDTPMEECTIATRESTDGSPKKHIGFRLVRELVLE